MSLSARDTKLVQYLNEAYGKEKELETALTAHIAMTTRAPYRKRLKEHLTETKRHARELERRIKRLGGTAELAPVPGPDAVVKGAGAVVALGSRAKAAAEGPLHMIRGTGEQEKMLKNAKTEYANEHEEIATYSAIVTLAESVGDRETATLARAIRREEESMARFLERLIPGLTKAVIQEEIPLAERRTAPRRKKAARATATSAARTTAAAKRTAKRTAKKVTTKKVTTKKATAKKAKATAKKATAKRTGAKKSAARKPVAATRKRQPARRS
jgi:ferritin-like metal-binding protein YciE